MKWDEEVRVGVLEFRSRFYFSEDVLWGGLVLVRG